jgi:hypothetical protein
MTCCIDLQFLSFTLIVFDGHQMELPAAWSIQQRETIEMIIDFLRVVKPAELEHKPDWKLNCFIIDCAPQEVAALKEIFVGIPILFCTFHVSR